MTSQPTCKSMAAATQPSADRDRYQQARLTRDARFDGEFYVAVKSTGIFCRPICPAKLPHEAQVIYFQYAAQALQAGFRPCLRCRPETHPGSWAWKGAETTFLRALKMLEAGALHSQSMENLATRLGISDRYLRQLFQQHLGMSPKKYALYHQLLLAKQLLHQSSLNIADIAYASGFNSIRRFNDAFKKTLQLSPSQIRKLSPDSCTQQQLTLSYRGPLDWQFMLDFYRLRALKSIEKIEQNRYSRHLLIHRRLAWFEIAPLQPGQLLVRFELQSASDLPALLAYIRRQFDLDARIDEIETYLNHKVPGLIKRSGIRIPGTGSVWEAGVRAILGQQITVSAAVTQLNRLLTAVESKRAASASVAPAFPTPEEILRVNPDCLKMPAARKNTLKAFAEFYAHTPESHPEAWLAIKGIGTWTLNYARLRGLGESNCFLHTDAIVKKVLVDKVQLNAHAVAPWGSYATLHCWNQSN